MTFLLLSCIIYTEARGEDICFDPLVAQPMLLEIQQCRISDKIMTEQDERLKVQEQIIQGKDEVIKIKNEIIGLKDDQIKTLKAAEVVKSLEDIISVQKGVIDGLRPSSATGIARFAMVILSIITFGMIH